MIVLVCTCQCPGDLLSPVLTCTSFVDGNNRLGALTGVIIHDTNTVKSDDSILRVNKIFSSVNSYSSVLCGYTNSILPNIKILGSYYNTNGFIFGTECFNFHNVDNRVNFCVFLLSACFSDTIQGSTLCSAACTSGFGINGLPCDIYVDGYHYTLSVSGVSLNLIAINNFPTDNRAISDVYSHEIFELITNPQPLTPGYVYHCTVNGAISGQEAGDVCNDVTFNYIHTDGCIVNLQRFPVKDQNNCACSMNTPCGHQYINSNSDYKVPALCTTSPSFSLSPINNPFTSPITVPVTQPTDPPISLITPTDQVPLNSDSLSLMIGLINFCFVLFVVSLVAL